ncbi:PH domain-containing protein [Cytobacillus sp. S13-E01]|uniref:PH domain-containing protein n=1 Tax=Cytobacillus sp. S13-E01 TaxID=3031326 RepID=UPI0023D83C10|nr:PH domain-containing protein [Cytobacillus sp. S13-E01]MDF0727682.1 PH domain-containing protein [Cytobacillus sp. S13-E01]
MSEPRRLHPVAALVNFVKQLKEMFIPVVLFIFFGGQGQDTFWQIIYFIGVGVLIIILLIVGVLHWYRYTYRVEDEELRIEYGVIVRKKRYIPLERIQTIDVSAGLIQRLFGLVKIQVETAGGGAKAEAVLTAVTETEAELLKQQLSKQAIKSETDAEPVNERIEIVPGYEISLPELFIAASTSGSIGVVLSALGAFLTQFDELIPYEALFDRFEDVVKVGVLFYSVIVFVIFLLAWIIGTVITILKYGNFSVVRIGDEVIIKRGIIEKRQLTLPIKRIQAIRISESIVRQPFGYATVYVENAGGATDKSEGLSTVLFPLVKKKKIGELLSKLVPDYTMPVQLGKIPDRALYRYVFRLMIPLLVVVIPVSIFVPKWGILALLLIPLFILWGYSRYRGAGWGINDKQVYIRYRIVSKTTVLLQKNRIQSIEKKQSLFQKRGNLGSFETSIKSMMGGKAFRVVDLEESDCDTMFKWYSSKKE